mgnify:CR=1 FL=1
MHVYMIKQKFTLESALVCRAINFRNYHAFIPYSLDVEVSHQADFVWKMSHYIHLN